MSYRSVDVLVLMISRLPGMRVASALRLLRWLRIYPSAVGGGGQFVGVRLASKAALVIPGQEDRNQAKDAKDQADQKPDPGVAPASCGGCGRQGGKDFPAFSWPDLGPAWIKLPRGFFSILTKIKLPLHLAIMEQISTIKSLLALWPSRRVIADDTGATLDAVNKWPLQNSVPARFHAALLDSAARHGVALSADLLARLHDHRLAAEAASGPDLAPNEDAA